MSSNGVEKNKDDSSNYQERLTHHYLCRISGTPILKQCPKQWFWN